MRRDKRITTGSGAAKLHETIFRSQASNVSNANPVRFDCFSPLKGDSNQGIGHEDVHWPTRPNCSSHLAGVLDLDSVARATTLTSRPPLGISDNPGSSGAFLVGTSFEKPEPLHTKPHCHGVLMEQKRAAARWVSPPIERR